LERKLLTDLSIDPDALTDEAEDLQGTVPPPVASSNGSFSASGGGGRHRISRVVVLHKDKLETFFNDPLDHRQARAGDDGGCETMAPQGTGDAFFDNESFWSGSITWY